MGASCPGRRHWEGRQKRNIQCRPNRVALTLAKFSTVVRKKLLYLIELFLSDRLGKLYNFFYCCKLFIVDFDRNKMTQRRKKIVINLNRYKTCHFK